MCDFSTCLLRSRKLILDFDFISLISLTLGLGRSCVSKQSLWQTVFLPCVMSQ